MTPAYKIRSALELAIRLRKELTKDNSENDMTLSIYQDALDSMNFLEQSTVVDVPEKWPASGPGYNEWQKDVSAFMRMVIANAGFWTMDHDLKYLNIRVDTRDGAFIIRNDDEKSRLAPDRVIAAINKYRAFLNRSIRGE